MAAWQRRQPAGTGHRRPEGARARAWGRAGGAVPGGAARDRPRRPAPSRDAAGQEPGPLRSFSTRGRPRGTAATLRDPRLARDGRRRRAGARPLTAPRGVGRPGLTRPRSRPPGLRDGRPSRPFPPAAGATGRARGDGDPPRRAPPRRRGPCRGGSLRSRRGCGNQKPTGNGSDGGRTPPRRPPAFSPAPRLSRPHRPSAARGRHPRAPGTRPAPAPGVLQGHLRTRGATRLSQSWVR